MKRKLSSAALFALAVGFALGGAALSRLQLFVDGPAGLLFAVGSLVAVVAAVVAVFLHWRRLDEAAREAHKAAWYWGGSAGLAVAGFGIGFLMARPELDLSRYAVGEGDAGLMVAGGMFVVAFQTVGYLVGWAWWWWSRR